MNSITAAFFRSIGRRRSLSHLRELDARLLADIGLTPVEVRRLSGRHLLLDVIGSGRR